MLIRRKLHRWRQRWNKDAGTPWNLKRMRKKMSLTILAAPSEGRQLKFPHLKCGGGYLYPLNICRLYQQSLSSTKCHRTAAQLYSPVIPWGSAALLMACFQEKVSSVSPGGAGGGVVSSAEVRFSGPPLTFCRPSLRGQEGVSQCWEERNKMPPPPLVILETAGQC